MNRILVSCRKNRYTQKEVVDVLRSHQGARSVQAYGEYLGFSGTYLYKVYSMQVQPSKRLLEYFGLRKSRSKITYVPVEGVK